MRKYLVVSLMACVAFALRGTTLQQLTLAQIALQSTAIVRGQLQPGATILRGSMLYTHYAVHVTERWKGRPISDMDVAVPGGRLNGVRQTYSGAPVVVPGQDYVLFLWTSPSGLTQIIGLSQGMFSVANSPAGQPMVMRSASSESMLNASGKAINDTDFAMRLTDFRSSVAHALSLSGGAK